MMNANNISAYLIITLIAIGSLIGFGLYAFSKQGSIVPEDELVSKGLKLKTFNSYNELLEFLKTHRDMFSRFYGPVILESSKAIPVTVTRATVTVVPTNTAAKMLEASLSTPEERKFVYSKTNVQVEGVDEADIIKTDGKFIYLLRSSMKGFYQIDTFPMPMPVTTKPVISPSKDVGEVLIIEAYPPEEVKVVSRLEISGQPIELYINDDKLVIFVQRFSNRGALLAVDIYDVSDRKSPSLLSEITLTGAYYTSRMIGNYVYVITFQPAQVVKERLSLPQIGLEDEMEEISVDKIYYYNSTEPYYNFALISAINLKNPEDFNYESFLIGFMSAIYVSMKNVYISAPVLEKVEESSFKRVTVIHRISIENGEIRYIVSGKVPGAVLNQFSMDEYKGYFRIATTQGHVARFLSKATARNNVYILDMNLQIVGKLENIAPGEKIYSARFMRDKCYLVTFKKVDPFFVIDLSNPSNPKVLGWLKIPGYSKYLHPLDENHVLGIGKETVEAEEGDFAWYQGVKISLFDVSDVENPVEIDKIVIGDRGTDTPILRNHKAFLYDYQRNLLIIPVLVCKIDESKYPGGVPPNAYGEPVWQGVYVLKIRPDKGIDVVGKITHIEGELNFRNIDKNTPYFIQRALYIDDILYTISYMKLKMNSLETLDGLGELALNP